jgi:hypothetical protein
MRRLWTTVFGLMLAGFASSAAAAASTNIDPGYYRKYTCPQLLEAGQEVSARAAALAPDLKKARANSVSATEDAVRMPAVISDAKPIAGEIALVKKQFLAIENASVQSQCQIEFLNSGQ